MPSANAAEEPVRSVPKANCTRTGLFGRCTADIEMTGERVVLGALALAPEAGREVGVRAGVTFVRFDDCVFMVSREV